MELIKFLPSPWTYRFYTKPWLLCVIDSQGYVLAKLGNGYHDHIQEANAKLMAASPELIHNLIASQATLFQTLEFLLKKVEHTKEVLELVTAIEVQMKANHDQIKPLTK